MTFNLTYHLKLYKRVSACIVLVLLFFSCQKEEIVPNAEIYKDIDIYIPNTITTNTYGNSVFTVEIAITNDSINDFHFIIFNKMKYKVFESFNAYETTWNGQYNNEFVPSDVYTWELNFRLGNGKKKFLAGHVFVLS
ncbi:gliding motility-associated C-terminal domain-containing protein [Putridiphycobacter roseus]|nr:gliding motility-associated C-terminal domain-containing protein [Putridiphycobacter roseus]